MKSNMYTFAPKAHLMLRTVFVSLLMIFIGASQVSAQTTASGKTIRGVVKSTEDNEPVPGTNIYLKSASSVGTFSDGNGQFEFPRQLKSGDIVVFSFLGLTTTEYVVTDESAGLISIMMAPDPIQMVDEILVEGKEPVRRSAIAKFLRRGRK
jgi:hypothetical protein